MSLPAVWTHLLESPLGPLGAVFDGRGGLCRLGFMPREEAAWPEGASWNGDRSFRYLLRQLEAYFRGDCRTFNVPLTLAIASTKVSLVLLFFMHLKYEGRAITLSFIGTICFLAIMIGFIFWDVAFR